MSSILKKIYAYEINEEIISLNTDTILFVVDEKVWSYHQDKFNLERLSQDKQVHIWIAPRGEETKRISEFEKCVESFLEKGIHRNAHLIAIGGGALSDFAGLVAASLLRGISWSVIPTTLLSMVDASIGGKVAINSRFGKNLIGCFHLPQNIWLSTEFLKTLPDEEYQSGLGEVIKYAFLSKDIYDLIMKKPEIEDIIEACASYKMKLTEEDLREEGIRKVLNLGHTIGHALEKAYSIKHGLAVFWGMVLFFHLFHEGKYVSYMREVTSILKWKEHSPPWSVSSVPIKKIISYIGKDKKLLSQDKIDLVHIADIGKPEIQEYTLSELIKKIEEVLDEPKTITV